MLFATDDDASSFIVGPPPDLSIYLYPRGLAGLPPHVGRPGRPLPPSARLPVGRARSCRYGTGRPGEPVRARPATMGDDDDAPKLQRGMPRAAAGRGGHCY